MHLIIVRTILTSTNIYSLILTETTNHHIYLLGTKNTTFISHSFFTHPSNPYLRPLGIFVLRWPPEAFY